MTPQNFDKLISQVRLMNINSSERLSGVIDLVFEKALDEPNFSTTYALMCKELEQIKVIIILFYSHPRINIVTLICVTILLISNP